MSNQTALWVGTSIPSQVSHMEVTPPRPGLFAAKSLPNDLKSTWMTPRIVIVVQSTNKSRGWFHHLCEPQTSFKAPSHPLGRLTDIFYEVADQFWG
jgi:hypothetical protein